MFMTSSKNRKKVYSIRVMFEIEKNNSKISLRLKKINIVCLYYIVRSVQLLLFTKIMTFQSFCRFLALNFGGTIRTTIFSFCIVKNEWRSFCIILTAFWSVWSTTRARAESLGIFLWTPHIITLTG